MERAAYVVGVSRFILQHWILVLGAEVCGREEAIMARMTMCLELSKENVLPMTCFAHWAGVFAW